MTNTTKRQRVIFIDLLRAFAVIMMVQGHTTDVLLSNDYRTDEYVLYTIWQFFRGMTAPIFLFTSGMIFFYLLKLNGKKFAENPRVKKGFYRFLLLVLIGYLLRYPTATIVFFNLVTPEQWKTFYSVDVLQLIGFSLLFCLICEYISEKLNLNIFGVLSLAGVVFFLAFLYFSKTNWIEHLHPFFAGYLYQGTGSNFPLFPWVGYVLFGAVLGAFLAKNPERVFSKHFSKIVLVVSSATLSISFIIFFIEAIAYNRTDFFELSLSLIIFRLAIVLLLVSLFSFIAHFLKKIPRLVILAGMNTLPIYVVHLVILYGSAWSPGIVLLWNRKLNIELTMLAVLIMFTLMSLMIILLSKYKMQNKLPK